MESASFEIRINELLSKAPTPKKKYYFFSLSGTFDGNLEWACYSHWIGYADEKEKIELREASIVRAEKTCQSLREIGESCAVVNNLDDLTLFYLVGGHVLIEKKVAESAIKEWLKPKPYVQSGSRGFVHVETLPKDAFNKAPSPKLRMLILKRDDYKCKICGRRAADYVDVELHVHHIRPWAEGGLTDDANLITLCHTCHKGLNPHFNQTLFSFLEHERDGSIVKQHVIKYWIGVQLYREKIVKGFSIGKDMQIE